MEEVLEVFNMNEEKFLRVKERVTSFIESYSNYTMETSSRQCFDYLSNIDLECDTYLQFGADKCEVDNFDEFCEDLNIDIKENLLKIIEEKRHHIESIRNGSTSKYDYKPTYVFYSRDKKITFTCSKAGNYMHYFGITGEYNKILDAFRIFRKRCTYDELCFGVRDYI